MKNKEKYSLYSRLFAILAVIITIVIHCIFKKWLITFILWLCFVIIAIVLEKNKPQ